MTSLVLVFALVAVPPSAAGEKPPPPKVDERRGGGTITHEVMDGDQDNGPSNQSPRSSSGTGRGSRGSSGPPVYYADIPFLGEAADGDLCIDFYREPRSSREAAAATEEAYEHTLLRLIGRFPLCETARRPRVNPATEAADFWRVAGEDELPRPQPEIDPGFMITGKKAYLEAKVPLSRRFEHRTPIGTLVIEAVGRIWVDWGDGSGRQGPYDNAGGPWPDGRITHVYTDVGHYDVVVTERWTARWRLGSTRGTLTELVTEGRIDDFPVRQIQAVRRR